MPNYMRHAHDQVAGCTNSDSYTDHGAAVGSHVMIGKAHASPLEHTGTL